MRALYVGLDVSKDSFKAAVKDEHGVLLVPVQTYRHDKEGLKAFYDDVEDLRAKYRKPAIFGMESTGIYHLQAYQYLLDAGAHVKVFNAMELKRFKGRIRKTKTDSLDAQAIADGLMFQGEPSYHAMSEPELSNLRELCRLRDRLVRRITLCKVEAIRDMDIICRGYSDMFNTIFCPSSIAVIKAVVRKTRFLKTDKDALARLLEAYVPRPAAENKAQKLCALFDNAVVPEHMRDITILEIHMLIEQYEILKNQLERLERRIENQVKGLKTHLTTIPGIGMLTAGILLGELGNINRFDSVKQLSAFAGLDPTIMESGRSRRTGHISKRGSPMLREVLYNAALTAIRINPVCRSFYLRLKAKGKHHKVCMIAVARKLLHIAYSVERRQKDFYVPPYLLDAQDDALVPLSA